MKNSCGLVNSEKSKIQHCVLYASEIKKINSNNKDELKRDSTKFLEIIFLKSRLSGKVMQ